MDAASAPLRWLKGERKAEPHTIWALDDVSFEIKHGEAVGIIGRNGAGKSTLLKILSRITRPTRGRVDLYGRVGSLLEVGTGFHPELTGRENIYLNGAILGMSRAEIQRKFDEIVDFAEVEKFLDTPVKFYSSGMYVRLAFAVAAHLEPEILVVDEVLAVGDAEFQKKCLGKMGDVAHEGRTVLFVSHNMGAISQLCGKGILIKEGKIKIFASTRNVIDEYLKNNHEIINTNFIGSLSQIITVKKILVNSFIGDKQIFISPSSKINITIFGNCGREIDDFRITFSLFRDGVRVLSLHDGQSYSDMPKGQFEVDFEIPDYFLRPGDYFVAVGGHNDGSTEYFWGTNLFVITIREEWGSKCDYDNIGIINLPIQGIRRIHDSARKNGLKLIL